MKHNKQCNVLGHYCWTHSIKTMPGVPGWRRQGHSDTWQIRSPWGGTKGNDSERFAGIVDVTHQFTEQIIWANGDTEDPKRGYMCTVCGNSPCNVNYPVPPSSDYSEVIGPNYRKWLESHEIKDVSREESLEDFRANPDSLQGV
jgi:hypothetical protein